MFVADQQRTTDISGEVYRSRFDRRRRLRVGGRLLASSRARTCQVPCTRRTATHWATASSRTTSRPSPAARSGRCGSSASLTPDVPAEGTATCSRRSVFAQCCSVKTTLRKRSPPCVAHAALVIERLYRAAPEVLGSRVHSACEQRNVAHPLIRVQPPHDSHPVVSIRERSYTFAHEGLRYSVGERRAGVGRAVLICHGLRIWRQTALCRDLWAQHLLRLTRGTTALQDWAATLDTPSRWQRTCSKSCVTQVARQDRLLLLVHRTCNGAL